MTPDEERPPLLRSWPALYALVLFALAAVIALFSAITFACR